MFIDTNTAIEIVKLNNIQCCAICLDYENVVTDEGATWFCNVNDIDLQGEAWVNVFKSNSCDEYSARVG